MTSIHPTAVIDATAELESDVAVGPYTVIGPRVQVGARSSIGPHVVIRGPTRIGADNRIFQFASVGEDPQDTKYGGEETFLAIGDGNLIREYTTLHRGTVQDAGITRIGNHNLFMAYSHVAHDCRIGSHVIMANAASLAGHVKVQDRAILGGFTIVHQFCRIGTHCFCAMGSVVTKDVPPYVIIGGHPAQPRGINTEGLRRREIDAATIQQLKNAYRILYLSDRKLEDAIAAMRALGNARVDQLADFVADRSRSIVR
ncbi:acyl-ACP--UDP-N-acetylglucosamine O-acyltransferase [Candidatus Thiosymbion oneisti]|uniref:acyl-ACP--UDP-N-acetylglucosamine O-acyltransferase n=1 Tax=Candidatus Thiosymbion oneisti TaxID=589554 RepID=UPI001A9C2D2F|nr:acyl-ACP--UDP-N-acetylglucosamine O-acyltransferase [Candidatus Thiosymbion oneisti]